MSQINAIIDASIYSDAPAGGVYRYLNEILTRLAKYPEVKMEFIAPRGAHIPFNLVNVEVVKDIFPTGQWIPEGQIKNVLRVVKKNIKTVLLKKRHTDSHDTLYHSPYYRLSLLSSIPQIFTIHDLITEISPELVGESFAIELNNRKKKCIEKATRLIAISECTKNDIVKIYGFPADKIDVIYHGVDSQYFSQKILVEKENQVLKDLDITSPFILYVGGRKHHKNFTRFLEAYSKSTYKKDFILVVVGPELEKVEKEFFKKLGVENRLRCLSNLGAELVTLYQRASLFVFPSLYEGFGMPLLEAMAAGCPVAASNTGPFPELGKQAALYFDPNNIEDINAKIEMLLDAKLAATYKLRGLERVRHFSWDNAAKLTLQTYQKTLE